MTCGSTIRIFTYENIPLVHISAFAVLTHHNITAVRNMLTRAQPGTLGGARKRRPLKYFRDGSTVWIPVKEVEGYPFIKGTNVYHYNYATGESYLCTTCTFTNEVCEKNKECIEMEVPKGDD